MISEFLFFYPNLQLKDLKKKYLIIAEGSGVARGKKLKKKKNFEKKIDFLAYISQL